MKTFYSIVLIAFALLFSCSTPGKQGEKSSKDAKNDTIVDTLAITILKEYFSNGKVKTETSAKGNVRHGLTKNYDRTGKLLSQVNYVNNTREGMATNFYPNSGKVNSTLIYKNGIKIDDEIWYYESGQPYRVTPYVKGVANGIQKYYYEDGKIKAEVPIKNGNPGIGLKEYKKDGTLITAGYPTLIITQKDYLASANKIILNIELSDPYVQVNFYKGALEEGKYITNKLFQLAAQNRMAQVDFNVHPGSTLKQSVVISANLKTPMGNPLILSKTFQINVMNKN